MIVADVAIAGAGIFGVTAALELRRRGASVTLLDPGPLPHPLASSTDISKIVRVDYASDVLYTELMEQALPKWRQWNARWPRPLFHETGFAVLSSLPFAPGSFEYESYELLSQRGHRLHRLNAQTIATRFPLWKQARFVDGYCNPQGGWAESGAVVSQLLADARAAGVALREGATVQAIEENGAATSVTLALRDGEEVQCDQLLVCAGAWTPILLPELAEQMTAVGQPALHFRPTDTACYQPPEFVPWAADIGRSGWYGFAANADGVVKVANHGPGVVCDPRAERRVPAAAEVRFRDFLQRCLPSLAAAAVASRRLCLYADRRGGDFLIDAHPERPGVYVAAGGSGHGFKMAPVLGPLIADRLEGKANPALARFSWHGDTRGKRQADAARWLGED